MQRLKNFLRWMRDGAGGACVLGVILIVAFWDSVVMGRSVDEQLERSER